MWEIILTALEAICQSIIEIYNTVCYMHMVTDHFVFWCAVHKVQGALLVQDLTDLNSFNIDYEWFLN